MDAFSTSLTTTVFSQRSMWWFEASARPATSKGQILHLLQSIDSQSLTYLHRDLRSSFVAHAVKGVDAWLAVVEVGWWDPFGVAVGAFSGGPAAGFDQWMVGSAGQGELVDVGAMGGCPVVDVVDFAPVAAHVTARARAASVLGMHVPVVHPRSVARSGGSNPAWLTREDTPGTRWRAVRAGAEGHTCGGA